MQTARDTAMWRGARFGLNAPHRFLSGCQQWRSSRTRTVLATWIVAAENERRRVLNYQKRARRCFQTAPVDPEALEIIEFLAAPQRCTTSPRRTENLNDSDHPRALGPSLETPPSEELTRLIG